MIQWCPTTNTTFGFSTVFILSHCRFQTKKTYPTNTSRSNRVFPRFFSNKTTAFWFSQLLKKTTINDPKNIKKRVYHITLYIYVFTTFRTSHCPPTSQRGGRDSQRIHSSNNSMDSITNASESSEEGGQVGGSQCFLGTRVNGRFFDCCCFWGSFLGGLNCWVVFLCSCEAKMKCSEGLS